MDYYIDPTSQYPQEARKDPGMNPVMQVLESVFGPNGSHVSTFKDCILISLDAEYEPHIHQIYQVGLASLDTRDISKADNAEMAKDLLSSRLLLFQEQSKKKGMYLFGEPETHPHQCIPSLLLSIFTIIDSDIGKPRNICLVGHSIRNDIVEIKRSTGFDILALPTIKAVVDTSPLISRIYHDSSCARSLRDTCRLLGMYRRNIHTAGNDAMYTLKALLLLFYDYKEQKQSWDFSDDSADRALLYECHLQAIKRIGRCNNGVDRFSKQRRRRERKAISHRGEGWKQSCDMLSRDETEEGVMDELFMIWNS